MMALAIALATGGLTAAADAASRYRDHVYADSFGNLIVYSRAGYKRIVVGKGHLAEQFSSREETGDGGAVYLDDLEDPRFLVRCYRPPVFVKGRSYMYGLAEGEMPDLWGGCR